MKPASAAQIRCRSKFRYHTRRAARAAALASGFDLTPYPCDHCPHWHLSSTRRVQMIERRRLEGGDRRCG